MNKYTFSRIAILFSWIAIVLLLSGCNPGKETKFQKERTAGDIYYESLFGETYSVQGFFLNDQKLNTETKLWLYTNLNRPLVLYGNYSNGMPTGIWNFALSGGTLMSSHWDIYKNRMTSCSFSVPFKCIEARVDSFSFKLTTMNDSLGKVTIIVQISNNIEKEENLTKFGMQADNALHEKGYTFTSNKREIKKDEQRYFFTEHFLKDSLDNDGKVYYLYGNTQSQKHFVQFTLFHEGPKEDLVKIIYNLMATSLYVDNERFFNPYKNTRD
jgi:hypothetical protein